MKIKKSAVKERWIDYPDEDGVKFKVRPFPMSEGTLAFGDDPKQLTEITWKKFNYCVVDWQGLVDDNDQTLDCNEENKRFLFDFVFDLVMWVVVEVNKDTENIREKKT